MFDMRFIALSVVLFAAGCAPAYTVPVPVDGDDRNRVSAFSTSEDPASNVSLQRDGKPLDEGTFEKEYLERVGDDDLERIAREKRRRAQGRTILIGSSLLVLGGGGLALVAVTQPRLCGHDASGNTQPGCGKAVLGVATLALLVGVGVYAIGCVAASGPDCAAIGHPPLERHEAETFVKRYNATVDGGAP
jgi:hypothetical protein